MKILIVSATEMEIAPLFKVAPSFCHFLVTGVGMTATAFEMGKALALNEYTLAINFGLAGSFNRNLEIGQLVNVVEDCFSELGAEDGDGFLSLTELNLPGEYSVNNTSNSINNSIIDLIPKVSGVTVNTVHGNDSSIDKVYKKYHPYVETMEGAAFLFACKQFKLPCAQIRAISNYIERRDKSKWNIPLAIEVLNKKAIEIIRSL